MVPGLSRGGTPADGGGRSSLKGGRAGALCTLPPAGSKGDASGFSPRRASSDIEGGKKLRNYSNCPGTLSRVAFVLRSAATNQVSDCKSVRIQCFPLHA